MVAGTSSRSPHEWEDVEHGCHCPRTVTIPSLPLSACPCRVAGLQVCFRLKISQAKPEVFTGRGACFTMQVQQKGFSEFKLFLCS